MPLSFSLSTFSSSTSPLELTFLLRELNLPRELGLTPSRTVVLDSETLVREFLRISLLVSLEASPNFSTSAAKVYIKDRMEGTMLASRTNLSFFSSLVILLISSVTLM